MFPAVMLALLMLSDFKPGQTTVKEPMCNYRFFTDHMTANFKVRRKNLLLMVHTEIKLPCTLIYNNLISNFLIDHTWAEICNGAALTGNTIPQSKQQKIPLKR